MLPRHPPSRPSRRSLCSWFLQFAQTAFFQLTPVERSDPLLVAVAAVGTYRSQGHRRERCASTVMVDQSARPGAAADTVVQRVTCGPTWAALVRHGSKSKGDGPAIGAQRAVRHCRGFAPLAGLARCSESSKERPYPVIPSVPALISISRFTRPYSSEVIGRS